MSSRCKKLANLKNSYHTVIEVTSGTGERGQHYVDNAYKAWMSEWNKLPTLDIPENLKPPCHCFSHTNDRMAIGSAIGWAMSR